MAENNIIQNYQNDNSVGNNYNNPNNVILRLMKREIQFNFDPKSFQTSIINSINNILNQNQPSGNQILNVVGNEIESMSKNLIEAFTQIRGTIDDLREACIKVYEEDFKYKKNNDENIQNIYCQNNELNENNKNITKKQDQIINNQVILKNDINNNINSIKEINNNMNDIQNNSKKIISENDLNLKKFKGENEKIIKEIDNINNGKLNELEEKLKIIDRKCNIYENNINNIKSSISNLENSNNNNSNKISQIENKTKQKYIKN